MDSVYRIVLHKFRQFGGFRVVRIYAKNGALWPMIKTIVSHPFSRQTYKDAYNLGMQKMALLLQRSYAPLMLERKSFYENQAFEHKRSKTIWFCWLQGLENAPTMVKACHASLLKNLPDRDVKVIDGNNWKEYVELPDYIVDKWEKKVIPPAHFSDLLRLQLLIRYGGTWIDSTVLCTGITPQNEEYTRPYLDADLFFFQYTPPGSNQWRGISNWFITACSNNELLMVLRDILYAYWKDYDCMIHYYMFHLFFSMLREVYPDKVAAMPYGYSMNSITLIYHLGDIFNQQKWDRFTLKVCFHKLLFDVKSKVIKGENNYYHHIVDEYLQEGE